MIAAPGGALPLRVSVLSRTGGRSRNEDACGWWAAAGRGCYVLADGAGGHGGGDVASRVAVEAVLDAFAALPEVSARSVAGLIATANDAVIARQRVDPAVVDMRSTLVVLQVDANARVAAWGHLGDSRLYRFRDGRVAECTRDHSLLQDMVDAGMIGADAAGRSRDRNVLTGSLGSAESYRPTVPGAPVAVRDGDAFLLCSDGFWDHVDAATMERTLGASDLPDGWLRRMEDVIAPRVRDGSDNYSALAVWCGDTDPTTRLYGAPLDPRESDGER